MTKPKDSRKYLIPCCNINKKGFVWDENKKLESYLNPLKKKVGKDKKDKKDTQPKKMISIIINKFTFPITEDKYFLLPTQINNLFLQNEKKYKDWNEGAFYMKGVKKNCGIKLKKNQI